MLTVFTDGQPADRTLVNSTMSSLHDQGSSVLSTLASAYTGALSNLNRRLSSLNARRQRANQVLPTTTLAKLDLSSFTSLDQARTTATVRIDALTATLRERVLANQPSIVSTTFTSDSGTVNTFGDLYQVYTANTSIPTGTFFTELASAVSASLLVFDIMATPSLPKVTVSVSADGSSYTEATSINIEGYRISALLPKSSVRYIKLTLQPTHPDNLDGSTYTFGVTALSLAEVQYQLASELASRPILITPRSTAFRFIADADPGVFFYLAINGGAFTQVVSGQATQVPGAAQTLATGVAISQATPGLLSNTLPANVYLETLSVTDGTTQAPYTVIPGLAPAAAGVSGLMNKYIGVSGAALHLLPASAADNAKTFNISYTTGPASLSIQLRVLISTEDRSTTPVFRGATFQEI